jgi:hypothetical protein
MPPDLKSLCGNRVIQWLTRFATPTGQAIERRWRKGSGAKEEEESRYGSVSKEVTGCRASRGAKGGGQDPAMMDLAKPARPSERAKLVEAVATVRGGVRLGLTLNNPPSRGTSPLYPRTQPKLT